MTLLLVGCTKENSLENSVIELNSTMAEITFTANLDSGVATKAVADSDGLGANVNRCIMEIYFQNQLYKRMVEPTTSGVATFANVPVVAGKEYQILFWADCGGAEKADKYYATNSGLKAVEVKDSFVTALQSGLNDELDAFFFTDNYTVPQAGGSYGATLKRPFAQLNVITTDVAAGKTVTSAALLPGMVSVNYSAATTINVANGEVSGSRTYSYEAPVYGDTTDWDTVKSRGELTLSMDYILASTEQGAVDVTFKTLNGTTEVMNHSLTNLPYKRNYRTNVKGDLLTTAGTWTATIDPLWSTPAYDVPFYVATSIQDAQNYIGSSSETVKSKSVDLTKAAISQSDVNTDKTIHFVLETTSPKDLVNFTLPAIPSTIENCEGWTIEYQNGYPTKNVGVDAPANTKVVINAPTSHVTVTGTSYVEIIASTGDNTLVIPQGVTVTTLKITNGAVEIHGTVNNLVVEPETGKTVVFRECEGLSAQVFAKIYSETEPVCNYIDPKYTYKQVGDKYNIYKRAAVAMIGDVEYQSIADAVAAVAVDNIETVTIEVLKDITLKASEALKVNKNNVVIDGKGHTITLDETDTTLEQYLVNGTSKKYGSFQMITISGNDVILRNLTLDSKNYRGASLATTYGGKNVSYENILYKGLGSGHYYGSAGGDGTLKFNNCTFETHGYAIHTAECQSILEVSNCEIHGWVSYGDKTKSATFTNTHFYSTDDQYNGVIATIRPYCATTITNCTFSEEYLTKYKYDGLTVRSNVVVSLKGCLVENGEICDIANITCPDDPWIDGGVMAIDATGNATDGFTAGTFVAKQASDITVASGCELQTVKDYVWKVVKEVLAKVNGVEYSSVGEAIEAAGVGDVIKVYGTTDFTKADDGFCYTDAANKSGRLVLVDLISAGSPTSNATCKINTAPSVPSMTFQTLWLGSERRLDAPGSYLKNSDVLVMPAKTIYLNHDGSGIYDVYGDITILGMKGKTVIKPITININKSSYRFFRLYNRYKQNITDNIVYHYNFKDITFDGSLEKHNAANLFVVTCYNIQINMDGCSVVNFPGSVFSIWANDTLTDGSYPTRENNVGVEVNITNSTLTANGRLVHYDCAPYNDSVNRYAFIHVNYDSNTTLQNTQMYDFNEKTAKGQGNCLLNGVDVRPAEN